MNLTSAELAARLGGVLHGPSTDLTNFATDSREAGPGTAFLCIQGAQVDGHKFWPQALAQGAAVAVAEREVEEPYILVPNLVEALANLGRSWRAEWSHPVIGITGSNGKTTTKELIAAALRSRGPVLKSPGNRNTEYTSPLVWAEAAGKGIAVIEMAMRGFGQIAHLARIHQPTLGIITGIGTAHAEMVGNREGICRAKSELLLALPANGLSILPADDDFIQDLRAAAPGPVRTFGFAPESDVVITGYRALSLTACQVAVRVDGTPYEFELPTVGRHNAKNAAAAIAVATAVDIDPATAIADLAHAEWPPMRLEIRERNAVTIIVDTYNASPDSTVAAIRSLREAPIAGRRLAVLGEMRELGDFTEGGHRLVGRALMESELDAVLLTGGPTKFIESEAVQAGFPPERIQSLDAPDPVAIHAWMQQAQPGDAILLKGSRALGLERALEVATE